ncbi:MAG TPA: hypothetical protein VNR60_12310 [Croceibacterium sp.]|nr:hypothetical protein [Croceibacterium sp.]
MVEFLPFLLIVIGWDVPSPDESMALRHSLHSTQEECEAEGAAFLEDRRDFMARTTARYRYFCIPAPTPEEYDSAFERLK